MITLRAALTTKTGWAGMAMIGYGLTKIFHDKDMSGIQEIMNGAGFIFAREAIAKHGDGRI